MHVQRIPEYKGNIRPADAFFVFHDVHSQAFNNGADKGMTFFEQLKKLMAFLLIFFKNALLMALLVLGVVLGFTYLVMRIAEILSLKIQFIPAFLVLMAWPSLLAYTVSSSVLIAISQANAKNIGLTGFLGAIVMGLLMPSHRFPDLELVMTSIIGTTLIAVPHYFVARKVFSGYFANDTDFIYRADAGEE